MSINQWKQNNVEFKNQNNYTSIYQEEKKKGCLLKRQRCGPREEWSEYKAENAMDEAS